MTAADRIEAEQADLLLIAQAMCKGEEAAGAAPCVCAGVTPMCAALDIYGDQAREVRAALQRAGRLSGQDAAVAP